MTQMPEDGTDRKGGKGEWAKGSVRITLSPFLPFIPYPCYPSPICAICVLTYTTYGNSRSARRRVQRKAWVNASA